MRAETLHAFHAPHALNARLAATSKRTVSVDLLRARRGFSLIELLLSVFILAIGIISISSLFPAGIAQQQMSTDDQLGPVVAEQALGLLRSRVSAEDFGTFEEFGITGQRLPSGIITDGVLGKSVTGGNGSYVFRPSAGDWTWIRPGVIRSNQTGTAIDDVGAIDLFATLAQNLNGSSQEFCEFPSGIQGTAVKLFGAPYNTARTGLAPPIIVTQRERWWPSVPEGAAVQTPPQYAWDCMFRRHGGRVQVAIFVYRLIGVGGAVKTYVSPRDGAPALPTQVASGYPAMPPVPFRRVLVSGSGSADLATSGPVLGLQVKAGWEQPATLSITGQNPYTTGLIGTAQGIATTDFAGASLPQVQQQWQFPGQWIIDNNGNVHRVSQGRRNATDPVQVRLSAPIPRVPSASVFDDYELQPNATFDPVPQGIRALYYVPAIIDANGTQLVPVYATVRDL